MVDLSERENGLWRRERGDRANTEYYSTWKKTKIIVVLKINEQFLGRQKRCEWFFENESIPVERGGCNVYSPKCKMPEEVFVMKVSTAGPKQLIGAFIK